MSYETYVPRPGYSVRPPDLPSAARDALTAPRPGPEPEPAHETVEIPVMTSPASAATVAPPEGPAPEGPPPEGPPPAPRSRRSRLRRLAEIPVLVVGALLFALLIKTFLLQAFSIPSGSMVPALEIGDRVLVEKVTFRFRDPRRGEIVVFDRPGVTAEGGLGAAVRSFFEDLGVMSPDEDIALIKRVIGLPGETVEIRAGRVMVDGRVLAEAEVVTDGRSFPPFVVPEDSYFVLGDNRGNSDDSRYSLGAVPRDEVIGRAFVVLWPPGNASVSLRTHYAGGDPTIDDGHAPAVSAALPHPDDAPEAPPP